MVTMTPDGYYPNETGRECFSSSLANLFLEMGDSEMAKQVYYRFKENPLQNSSTGVFVKTSTRLVRDLTEGLYDSMLLGGLQSGKPVISEEQLEAIAERFGNQNVGVIVQMIEEEMRLGKITEVSVGDEIRYDAPCILNLDEFNLGSLTGESVGHCVVKRADETYISEGRLLGKDILVLAHSALQVYRNS